MWFGPLDTDPGIFNPVGVRGDVGDFVAAVGRVGVFLLLASMFLAAVSLIVRLVRARGEERQQIKWLAFAAAVMIGGFSTAFLFPSSWLNGLGWFLGTLGFFLFPVAVGIAILRHRLYDIDIVINRTLVYGTLSVMLAAVYFGSVAASQRLLSPLMGEDNQLAAVASTLAIAALFNPLRKRIQSFVDRRFYRRKYDGAKTLEAFSAKLRSETVLENLNDDLVAVAQETLQPSHVSLWLRSPDSEPSRMPGEK